MAFPDTLKTKTDIGTYIPDDKLNGLLKRLTNKIDKILANARKGLEVLTVTRETVTIEVDVARQIVITLPLGTTVAEQVKIAKVINDEVMVEQIALPTPVLDQSQHSVNVEFLTGVIPNHYWSRPIAQIFTSGITGFLTSLKLHVGTIGDYPNDTYTIQIRAVNASGLPSETILAETIFPDTGFGYSYPDHPMVEFKFDDPAHLVAGIKYAIYISGLSGTSYCLGFSGIADSNVHYASGNFYFNHLGTWDINESTDGFTYANGPKSLWFETYMLAG